MNEINQNSTVNALPGEPEDVNQYAAPVSPRGAKKIALAVAILASAISLGVTVRAGLHRADSIDEQVWSVAMALMSVVCLHLTPMLCRFVSFGARFVLGTLWLLAACVVLRGQVDVLAFADLHAADKRAQSVATVVVPPVATDSSGRGLMAIAQDIVNTTIDLAHAEARRCVGECRSLTMQKTVLSVQLVALNAEADEAKRRAIEPDWIRDRASRAEELRESRRADPATSLVAPSLGTTEARLNTLLDLACVVVLEGVACFAWYFAGLRPVAVGRAAVASDRQAIVPRHEPVAPVSDVVPDSRVEPVAVVAIVPVGLETVANATGGSSMVSEDDRLVAKIHADVVAGRLKRNLVSIREYLACGQANAARLNRLYIDRFGKQSDRKMRRTHVVSAA